MDRVLIRGDHMYQQQQPQQPYYQAPQYPAGGGYNPYPGQYVAPYPAPQVRRSAIPKVMGILMIIFASLGLIGSLMNLAGSGSVEFRGIPELETWRKIELLFAVVGLGIGLLHLVTGIKSVGYKAAAPRLSVIYSVIAIVSAIAHSVLFYAWIKPIMDKALGFGAGFMGMMTLVGTIIAVIWPALVAILMTRPAAKAACVNEL